MEGAAVEGGGGGGGLKGAWSEIYLANRILNAAWEFSPFMVATEIGQ